MKIKVCGMKYSENMVKVATLNPDYMGFIFWEPSVRSFSGALPAIPSHIRKVGVFVDASLDAILEKVAVYHLDMVQLHGNESPEFCQLLREVLNKTVSPEGEAQRGVGIIKAISVSDHFPFEDLKPYQASVDYFLFDSKGPLPGGNGFGFNWELLNNYSLDTPFFLSGGIGMGELEKLVAFSRTPQAEKCHAIDVNSAFETEPGLKDAEILQEFIKNIKR